MRECPLCTASRGFIFDEQGEMQPCPRCTLPGHTRGSGFVFLDERAVPLGETPLDRRRQMHLLED